MSETQLLSALDASDLRANGLLQAGETQGVQRIHKRRLNQSSDEENKHIPLTVTTTSTAYNNAFASIPKLLISRETILFVGFSESKATQLWDSWSHWPAIGPLREVDIDDGGLIMSFKAFVTGAFSADGDVTDGNSGDWRACLTKYGISTTTQDAIMDPAYDEIRLSESCMFWAKDTVEMRYAGLEDIQRSSRQREMQLQRATTRPGSAGRSGGGGHSVGGLDRSTGASPSTGQGRRSVSEMQQQGTPEISLDTWGSARAIAASNAPGHVVLFKSVDQARTHGLLDDNGHLARLSTIISNPPSDFSPNRAMYYFTPERAVAEMYASYAKRRAGVVSVVIVCIRVPNAAIESIAKSKKLTIHWPSDEWKELVWNCRRGQTRIPKPFGKYRDATLIIGSVSRKPDSSYHELKSWKEISERYLLKVNGRRMVQYVFSGEAEGVEILEEGIQHIDVFPYVP